jgi:hypothetical protein
MAPTIQTNERRDRGQVFNLAHILRWFWDECKPQLRARGLGGGVNSNLIGLASFRREITVGRSSQRSSIAMVSRSGDTPRTGGH